MDEYNEELKKIIEMFLGFEIPEDFDWEKMRVTQYGQFRLDGYEPFIAQIPKQIEMN